LTNFKALLPAGDIGPNQSRAVTLGEHKLLVCRAADDYYVVENRCTHQASALEGGRIRNCHISCPLHGVRFNLETGEPLGTLTRVPLKTYPVRISDGTLEVALD
jgi:3-phenylpropionate/trans-cinnamate dioxygenase ferredoxin subunit